MAARPPERGAAPNNGVTSDDHPRVRLVSDQRGRGPSQNFLHEA
jgi:hypothetical protein